MDTDKLTVFRIYCKESSQDLQFTVDNPIAEFGSKLQIVLLPSFAEKYVGI